MEDTFARQRVPVTQFMSVDNKATRQLVPKQAFISYHVQLLPRMEEDLAGIYCFRPFLPPCRTSFPARRNS